MKINIRTSINIAAGSFMGIILGQLFSRPILGAAVGAWIGFFFELILQHREDLNL